MPPGPALDSLIELGVYEIETDSPREFSLLAQLAFDAMNDLLANKGIDAQEYIEAVLPVAVRPAHAMALAIIDSLGLGE